MEHMINPHFSHRSILVNHGRKIINDVDGKSWMVNVTFLYII